MIENVAARRSETHGTPSLTARALLRIPANELEELVKYLQEVAGKEEG